MVYPVDSVCYMLERGGYSTWLKEDEAVTVLENEYIRAVVPDDPITGTRFCDVHMKEYTCSVDGAGTEVFRVEDGAIFTITPTMRQHVCSICGTDANIVCDNDCGRRYCSDVCADRDDDHLCNEDEFM